MEEWNFLIRTIAWGVQWQGFHLDYKNVIAFWHFILIVYYLKLLQEHGCVSGICRHYSFQFVQNVKGKQTLKMQWDFPRQCLMCLQEILCQKSVLICGYFFFRLVLLISLLILLIFRETLHHWFRVWIIQLQRLWHWKSLQWICRLWLWLQLVCLQFFFFLFSPFSVACVDLLTIEFV